MFLSFTQPHALPMEKNMTSTSIKCLPFRISFRCLNHDWQWSSLKLFKWTAQSVSLFSSLFKHLKIVIPNKVPPFFCPAKRRRFSFTENTSFISIISSWACKATLESPVRGKKIKRKALIIWLGVTTESIVRASSLDSLLASVHACIETYDISFPLIIGLFFYQLCYASSCINKTISKRLFTQLSGVQNN